MGEVRRERREEAKHVLPKLFHADILHEDEAVNRELILLLLEATIRNFDSYGQHETTNVKFPYAVHLYDRECAVMFILGSGPAYMLFSLDSKYLPSLSAENLRKLTDDDVYSLRVEAKFACFGDIEFMPLWIAVKEAGMFEMIVSMMSKKALKEVLESIRIKEGR